MFMLKVAWRYVHARLINYAAVLVVGLTLMASIVVLGVIDGMLVDMERRIRDLGEQLVVYFNDPIPQSELANIRFAPDAGAAPDTTNVVRLPSGVRGFTPQVADYALLKHGMISEPGQAFGIDLAQEVRLTTLADGLLDLKIDRKNPQWVQPGRDTGGLPCAFVAVQLADRLDLRPGDTFEVTYAPEGSEQLRRKEFYVSSIFKSGSPFKDSYGFYIPISEAQKMFLTPLQAQQGGVLALSFMLHDSKQANALETPVARAVAQSLHARGVRATTWQKRWRTMYEGMAYENMLMEVVLFFMNFSAGFCVFAVLATLVSRRVRDVGLLRCLGAGRRHTVGTFLLVGLIMGAMGTVLGVAGGYIVGLNINGIWEFVTGEPLYPPHMFGTVSEPVILPHKVATYALGAMLISVLSALYPAIWAGCREPVEALRDE